MRILIDGIPTAESDATISVFDWTVIRGFGVFEVVRSYDGATFRLGAHLDRLERSATALGIVPPGRDRLAGWVSDIAAAMGDGQVRVIVTGGGRDPEVAAASRTIVMGEPLPEVPERLSVLPTVAPWHPATDTSGFPGVKWVSYAPNILATDRARAAGYSEALLVTPEGIVLEGPTFTVAWVADGRVETPSLDLGILASITREVMRECAVMVGVEVTEGRYSLDRVLAADEVFALSTVKQVRPIDRIGDDEIGTGPITRSLAGSFAEVVRSETGHMPPQTP